MVVATLFHQFGDSNRGLSRREVPLAAKEWYRSPLESRRRLSVSAEQQEGDDEISLSMELSMIPATKPKRKRCKASKFLASLAADLDVVTDWVFFHHTGEIS